MKYNSTSAVVCFVLLLLHCSGSISHGRNSQDHSDGTKDTNNNKYRSSHHRIRHKRIPSQLEANFKFEDELITPTEKLLATPTYGTTRIRYKKTPHVHRKRRKEFILNYNVGNSNVTRTSSGYPSKTKSFENVMDVKLDLTISNGDDRALARERILHDKTRSLCRRRRYTVPYGTSWNYNVRPYVPCTGWSNYHPHGCISSCVNCRNPCSRYPKPTTYTTPFYQGSAKDWFGVKYGCNCNLRGSELTTCDIKTGNCRCKSHYTGRTCDKCENGFWENAKGCISCDCNIEGSRASSCEHSTGRCYCKEGVGGDKCNTCAKGYYGFSRNGCKQCDDCKKPGHICDPKTGRCVCPPNSHGIYCEKCLSNTWGHEPQIGCKKCNCSKFGTKRPECDIKTGQCTCDVAYFGQNCDRCAPGYYGFPKCRPCNCNKAGTRCNGELCQCNENGQCPCKRNVIGKTCNQCKGETFGLDKSNPNGCTECFCFGRSRKCSNAIYTWDQIPSNQIVSNNLTQKMNSLYWRLPQVFKGDRLLSYNGYLRFQIESKSNILPKIRNDPLVVLEGNRLEVYRYLPTTVVQQKYEVQLQENMWRTSHKNKISRMDFMVLLQNISDIYIRASDAHVREDNVLVSVTLDTATEVKTRLNIYKPVTGIEKCECPSQYTSSSCQTPSPGYCKKRNYYDNGRPPIFGRISIDNVVGRSVPCECNGRSRTCDSETCRCQNCTENTAGHRCEKCAEGFYGTPAERCRPCPCPNTDRNFATSCDIMKGTCRCKPGYEGRKCEKCAEDYYGNPLQPGGSCRPCDCNPGGIIRRGCDSTGQCFCRNGITGRKCSMCQEPRHVLENNFCIPCDNCTQELLDQLNEMDLFLYGNTSHLLHNQIEPPWKQLRLFEDQYTDLAVQVDIYATAVDQAKNIINRANLGKHLNNVNKIQSDFDMTKLKLDVLVGKINNDHNQTLSTLSDIKNSKRDIEEYIENLNNFGKSHISTREAVNEGKTILKYMKQQSKKVQSIDEDSVIHACMSVQKVLDAIIKHNINRTTHLADLHHKLNEINEFLSSASKLLLTTNSTINKANEKNARNEKALQILTNKLPLALNKSLSINMELKVTNDNITKTKKVLKDIDQIMTKIMDELFDDIVGELKRNKQKIEEHIQQLKIKLHDAKNHTKTLVEKVQYVEKILEKKDKQVNAEKASEAYATIATLLQQANETASEANAILKKLREEVEPTGMDSLYDKVYMMSANASQLQSRIGNILNLRSPEIEAKMAAIQNRLIGIKDRNWDNGIKDRKLNILINQMLNEYDVADVHTLIMDAMEKSQKMKETYKLADEMDVRIQYQLKKEAQRLQKVTSPNETAEIKKKINDTRTHLQDMLKKFTDFKFDESKETFNFESNNITRKLEELKARILKAKGLADGIRVSMSGQSCTRTYKINNLEPSLITLLKMKFSLNPKRLEKSYSMFHLPNNDDHFIQLLVSKNRITFVIKLQKEPQRLEMEFLGDNVTVNVERFYTMLRMTVNGESKNVHLKHGNTRFNINPTNLIYVGTGSDVRGLPGCIHDITFNGNKIGLWKFEQTGQCEGCSRSITGSDSTPVYRFNGEGFSMIKEGKDLAPYKFDVNFWFTTFDENALLFLAPHTPSGSYLALTLHDGYIKYEVHYNGGEETPLELKTSKKYNDGKKHYVNLVKYFESKEKNETSKLTVDKDVMQGSRKISKAQLLKVKKTYLYVGGVSPDYFVEYNGTTDTLHTHQSFLGDIENFKLTNFISLHETNTKQHQYGVVLTNKPLEFRKAWFEGVGYLKLKPQNFKFANTSIIFLIRTADSNSPIMKIGNLTKFVMEDGYISVKVKTKSLTSKLRINDDKYHMIELVKKSQDYILKIDGVKAEKREIVLESFEESETIFIGNDTDATNTKHYFNGEISDIFIDNTLMKFNADTIDSFEKVKIGRSKPKRYNAEVRNSVVSGDLRSGVITENDNPKDQQSIDGCDRSTNNSLELDAAQFGDTPESYVKYYLKEQFWKEDFSVELVFRTFSKNGILLYSQSDAKHYNLIELKEGLVSLHISGKRKKSINASKRLDDGEWHRLVIESKAKRRKRKVAIIVDGRKEKPKKIPQNRVSGDVFIGGIPHNLQQKLPKQLISKLVPFKGCIKELKINQAPQSFLQHHNIGLCFSHIEKGSYFRGDAFVVYKRDFKISNSLELKFEFRTKEQNGILMSVSTVSNSPALSLELQNGAVVMSVDMGNGIVSNVTNFHSAYALCDNKWHNVTALFSTELTVNVDGVSKSWVISEMGFVDEIEDPLYIGGLPDIAPAGTLKIKENFKGCIRNVKIGENYVDWMDMEELTNVSLNSCPVA
ncbi:hypothetical protein Trydic_g8109 [Trypoxylus dichotomus]